MKRRLLIVYHPHSGRRRKTAAWHSMEANLKSTFDVSLCNLKDDPMPSAEAMKNLYGLVVVGGDGTIRRATRHLLTFELDLPIAIVPRGSANLLAQGLRLPHSIKQICRLITEGSTMAVDVARVNGTEYFLSALATGYLSQRVAAADQRLKNHLGFMAYIGSLLAAWRLPEHHFAFEVDGQKNNIPGHSLFIVNSPRLFGLNTRRPSDLTDGVFELAVVRNRSFLSWPQVLYYYYRRHQPPKHLFLAHGNRFTLQNDSEQALLDGDLINVGRTINIAVCPRRQRFFAAQK